MTESSQGINFVMWHMACRRACKWQIIPSGTAANPPSAQPENQPLKSTTRGSYLRAVRLVPVLFFSDKSIPEDRFASSCVVDFGQISTFNFGTGLFTTHSGLAVLSITVATALMAPLEVVICECASDVFLFIIPEL